jgi:hypothetical protein
MVTFSSLCGGSVIDVKAFEVVLVVVVVLSVFVAALPSFRIGRALNELGRQGYTWFETPSDRAIEAQPSEDARDAPIPRRPLRGRITI